jgi:hypothetical protein
MNSDAETKLRQLQESSSFHINHYNCVLQEKNALAQRTNELENIVKQANERQNAWSTEVEAVRAIYSQNENLIQMNNKLTSEISAFEAAASKMTSDYNSREEYFHSYVNQLHETNSALLNEVQELKVKNSRYVRENESLVSKIQFLEDKLSTHAKEAKEMEAAYQGQLKQVQDSCRASLENANTLTSSQAGQLFHNRKEITELHQVNQSQKQNVHQLSHELKATQAANGK